MLDWHSSKTWICVICSSSFLTHPCNKWEVPRRGCLALLFYLSSGSCSASCHPVRWLHTVNLLCSDKRGHAERSVCFLTGSGPGWPGPWHYQYSCSLPTGSSLWHMQLAMPCLAGGASSMQGVGNTNLNEGWLTASANFQALLFPVSLPEGFGWSINELFCVCTCQSSSVVCHKPVESQDHLVWYY